MGAHSLSGLLAFLVLNSIDFYTCSRFFRGLFQTPRRLNESPVTQWAVSLLGLSLLCKSPRFPVTPRRLIHSPLTQWAFSLLGLWS